MDAETLRPFLQVAQRSSSTASLDGLSNDSQSSSASYFIKKRELCAWFVIALQACALAFAIQPNFPQKTPLHVSILSETTLNNPQSINNKLPSYHEQRFLKATSKSSQDPFYEPPTVYPAAAGLVSRVWHSNGSPEVNEGLQTDHIWLVRRNTGGLMALMGGFAEVGETVEEASRRELKEEMNIDLPGQPLTLFGVYSDPKRDSRKHAVSVVFHMDIPPHITPAAGDDAREVVRMPLSDVEDLDMFIDHKTVLRDFIKMRERQRLHRQGEDSHPIPHTGDGEPFKRSVCELPIL